MKIKSLRWIFILVFLLIAATGILFMAIAYYSAQRFQQATTQLLNREVAEHISKFTSPYKKGGIDRSTADSVFHNAMVLSPSIEVYFLDTAGKVMYYDAPDKEIVQKTVPLQPIQSYLAASGKAYITGTDPKDPGDDKIFSAAEVRVDGKKEGYIYVILGSKEFREAIQVLYNSHISSFLLKAFIFITIISIMITWLYLRRVEKRFNRMIDVLNRFNTGDYSARFQQEKNSEFFLFTESFNHMADLLQENIGRLKRSEEDRKQLVVNISHDLRTPLSIARGYGETLLISESDRNNISAKSRRHIELVVQKITQVEHMVSQLFELSRIESAEMAAQKQPFVFSEIVFEVVNSMNLQAAEKNITIDCSERADHSWIEADIKMMESVVQNLVVNAISYTDGPGTITVEVVRIGNNIIFSVENPASPLPREIVEWLNDHSAEKNKSIPQRSMIGLTIVKRIVSLHMFTFTVQHIMGKNVLSISMPVFMARQ